MVGAFGEVLVMDWGLAKIATEGGGQSAEGEERRVKSEGRGAKGEGREVKGEERKVREEEYDSVNGKLAIPTAPETLHGAVMGTPAYMAPEQKNGQVDQIDQRTDVFALGAILKFLLGRSAGKPSRESPTSPKIPKSLAAIYEKAMMENKTQRYATALDLASDIERFLNGLSVSSYQENPFEIIWRWLKKYQFMVLLVFIYLLVRILLFFWFRP